jgi:hypothetical protein
VTQLDGLVSLAEPLEQPRMPLDVGEEKGDDSGRQVSRHKRMVRRTVKRETAFAARGVGSDHSLVVWPRECDT